MAVLHQRQHLKHHLVFQQALFLRQDALAEQLLQLLQLTAFEQYLVAADLRHQRLLGRQRQYVGTVDAELLCCGCANVFDSLLDEGFAGDIVPEHINLVEHGEQAALGVFVKLTDMLLPDLHIAGGNAGVGGEQENDRLSVGQHRQGQFRFAA